MALTQSRVGLVTFDDMERPSSSTFGAPTFPVAAAAWTEIETLAANIGIRTHVSPTLQVGQNQNNASSSNEAYMTPTHPGATQGGGLTTMVQVNIDHDNSGFGGIRIPLGDPAPNGGIFGIAIAFVNPAGVPALEVWNFLGVPQCSVGVAFPNSRTIRLVLRDQGGGMVIGQAIYSTIAVAPFLSGLATPLSLICTTAPFAVGGAVLSTGFQGVVHQRAGDSKMFIRCGVDVVVVGLPPGWGARLDGGAVTVETAGIAVINTDLLPVPYTEVQVVDNFLVQQDQFTPTAGIAQGAPAGGWGGDQFVLIISPAPDPPTDLTCLCIETELAIQLNWVDNSMNEDGFRIERSLDDTFTTIVSFIVGPNITEFIDDTVEESTRYFYRVFAFNAAGGDSTVSNTVNCLGRVWTECFVPPVTAYAKFENPSVCPGTGDAWDDGYDEGYG